MRNKPEENEEDEETRVYIVNAKDEAGDTHMVVTSDGLRAVQHYDRLSQTFGRVTGNYAFEALIRPNLGLVRDMLASSRKPN